MQTVYFIHLESNKLSGIYKLETQERGVIWQRDM